MFGFGNEKPKDVVKCINTWKKYLPNYEIIEWNEKNFDINSHPFVKAAYEAKKWAFVSDYIRMYAVYNHGGIYFDTDVLVLSNLDEFLDNRVFVGFEDKDIPFTAVFGAEPKNELISQILSYYDNAGFNFSPEDANTYVVTKILINKYKCKLGNIEQTLDNSIKVYKSEILCKPSLKSKTIHVFSGTWIDGKKRWINKFDRAFRLCLTNKIMIIIYIPFKQLLIFSKWIGRSIFKRSKDEK